MSKVSAIPAGVGVAGFVAVVTYSVAGAVHLAMGDGDGAKRCAAFAAGALVTGMLAGVAAVKLDEKEKATPGEK